MKRLLFAFLWVLLGAGISFAQNTTALAPQALPGLNVQVRGGTILLANSSIGISNTTVALSNNTTNYVFLSSAGVVQTNTTGFTSTVLPIATVLTAQGQIVDIQDNRPDYIFAGGGSGLPAGPTSPNVPFGLTETPSGGVAGAATWSFPGVTLTSQTGATYTLNATDRSTCVEINNAAMTLTVPDVGGTGFQFGYQGCLLNLGAAATINNTSSSKFNLFGALTSTLQTTFSLAANQAAYFYSSPNSNWDVVIMGAGSGTITSCATTNALGIFTASTTFGCGNGDFTYTTHTLTGGASAIEDLHSTPASSLVLSDTQCTGAQGAHLAISGHVAGSNELVICESATVFKAAVLSTDTTTCTNQAFTVFSDSAAPTCGSPLFKNSPGTLIVTGADVTCGTGGTIASCTSATTITGLSITLPSALLNWSFDCHGVVGQATGVVANQWLIQTATNGATNVTASYDMGTAATASAYGAVTDQASTTTAFQITPSWTLGATGTKMPFHIWGTVEGASASGTTLNIQVINSNNSDLLTIYRGASCHVF